MPNTQTPTAPAHEQAQQTIERLKSRLECAEKQMKGLQFSIPGLAILAYVPLFMQLNKPTVMLRENRDRPSFSVQSTRVTLVA